MKNPRAVVLLSGGLDSTTLLYLMIDQGYEPLALSANYGQRHARELASAAKICRENDLHHFTVKLDFDLLSGSSALTGGGEVPEGHYAADNMKQTVVPNRNAIMLAMAYGFAVKHQAVKVCTAVHAGDHAIYPDCRPGFIKAFEEMEREAITQEIYGMSCPDLYAPFVLLSKADIVTIGNALKVPYAQTWSCYRGIGVHCGRCGTCVERIEAFKKAGVEDPTEYEDKDFAESVL